MTAPRKKSDRKAEALLLVGALLFIAAWAGSVVLWGIPGLLYPGGDPSCR